MPETDVLKPAEKRFIKILNEPADKKSPQEIAELVGVSLRKYEEYLENFSLLKRAYQKSSLLAMSRLPRVLQVFANKAVDGDLNAAKFLMQHAQEIGLTSIEPDQMSAEEVVRLVRQIIEEQQSPPGEATP